MSRGAPTGFGATATGAARSPPAPVRLVAVLAVGLSAASSAESPDETDDALAARADVVATVTVKAVLELRNHVGYAPPHGPKVRVTIDRLHKGSAPKSLDLYLPYSAEPPKPGTTWRAFLCKPCEGAAVDPKDYACLGTRTGCRAWRTAKDLELRPEPPPGADAGSR